MADFNHNKHIILIVLVLLFLFIPSVRVFSQVSDTLNMTDEKGRKQGYWKKAEGGVLKYEGRFTDDKPSGKFIYYYPTGKVKAITWFSDNGRIAYTTTFFAGGAKMAEGKYTGTDKDSVWTYFNEDNIKVSEESYLRGIRHGEWKTYYPNGQVSEVISWKNGKREGPWNTYFQNGKVRSRASYASDKLLGLSQSYYPNGMVMISGHYKQSLKDGIWMTFRDDGQTMKKEVWRSGRLVEEIEYNKDEKIIQHRDENEQYIKED